MNTEELKQKALKCYGWRNASSAWLHESGDGSAVVGNIDDSHDPAMRNPVAVVDVTHYDGFQDDSIELAQFYAAANPATILALIAERDELLANIPEWHCKICNTIHLPPSGFNLCCHTPKCTGMLKPSSQSIRIAEDQRDEALAKLDRAQAEIRALEFNLLEREGKS